MAPRPPRARFNKAVHQPQFCQPYRLPQTYLTSPTKYNKLKLPYKVMKLGITCQSTLTPEKYFEMRGYGRGTKPISMCIHPDLTADQLEYEVEKPALYKLQEKGFKLLPRKKEHFRVPFHRVNEFVELAKTLM